MVECLPTRVPAFSTSSARCSARRVSARCRTHDELQDAVAHDIGDSRHESGVDVGDARGGVHGGRAREIKVVDLAAIEPNGLDVASVVERDVQARQVDTVGERPDFDKVGDVALEDGLRLEGSGPTSGQRVSGVTGRLARTASAAVHDAYVGEVVQPEELKGGDLVGDVLLEAAPCLHKRRVEVGLLNGGCTEDTD